jgi:hypothetical protein
VWKRKGDSAGWPWPLLLPTAGARRLRALAQTQTNLAAFTPSLALRGHGTVAPLQARMQNAATPSGPPFCRSSRLVARLAVGGWRQLLSIVMACRAAARARTTRRRCEARVQQSAACASRLRVSGGRDGDGDGWTASARRAAACPGTPPFLARPGPAPILPARSQAGVAASAWLLRRPGLIRHGRCRSRACDLRGPLIVLDAAAIIYITRCVARTTTSAPAPLLSPVPLRCLRTALARTRLFDDAAAARAPSRNHRQWDRRGQLAAP